MAFSTESGAQQATPVAPKAYNGGAVTATPGNNQVTINIAQSAAGVLMTGAGQYRISRSVVANGAVGAYAVLATIAAPQAGAQANPSAAAVQYVDNTAQNGTTYSYTVALDNLA